MTEVKMNLKQWRKANKLSQKEVATTIGVAPMTICYWEKRGVKRTDNIAILKMLSRHEINDFRGKDDA